MDESTEGIPFGILLKRYRRAAQLTQELLAERAGYSAIYLSKLERGERQPLALTVTCLADALGIDAPARAALQHAAQRSLSPPPVLPPAPAPMGSDALLPLIGRTEEQVRLSHFLRGSGPPLLLVLGEPGIGKTSLLQEAIQQGQHYGWRVLEGRCHRHSGQELYAPLLGALERHLAGLSADAQREALQQCDWLLRLLPDLAERTGLALPSWNVPPAQERRLLFAAVRRFLSQIAGVSGTLLVLDDLQWASLDTLDLLASLLRSEARRPLRVIGAYRQTEIRSTDPLSVAMADMAREVGAERLELGPLAPPEAEHLLSMLLEGSAVGHHGALLETVLRRAGGVPYFLVSCAEGLRTGTLGSEAIPWHVAETIRQRVGTLSEEAQYLLGAVAVAGNEARRPVLLALAAQLGWGKRAVLFALEETGQAGLLVEHDAARYAFAHDLIRELLTEDMSAVRRAILHQHIAELLEQETVQPPVEVLAYHYSQAGLPEKAMSYLERAGDHARSAHAHEQAERSYRAWLEHVVQLERPSDAARARVKLSGALLARGHYREALPLLEEALAWYQQTHDLEAEASIIEQLGHAYGALGEAEQGILVLQRWLTAPTLHTLSVSRQCALYLTLTFLLTNSSRTTEALSAAEQAAALAEQAQDTQQQGVAGWYLGRVLLILGRMNEATQTLQAALPLAEQSKDLRCLCHLFFCLCLIAVERGEPVAGKQYAERATELAELLGEPALLAHVLVSRGFAAFILGNWQYAQQDYEHAISLLREAAMPWGVAYPLLNLGELLLAQGQEVGRARLEEAIEQARRSEDAQALWLAQGILAEQDMLLGAPQHAFDRLKPLLETLPHQQEDLTSLLPMLAWAQVELGQGDQAQSLLEQAHARASGKPLRLVEVLLVQARLAATRKRWQETEEALEVALGLCRKMPWPQGEGKTRFAFGLVARELGERAQAHAHFTTALSILHRLGEWLYAGAIQQALDLLPPPEQQKGTE